MRRDDLDELLSYRPAVGQPSRQRLLSDALRRMEAGQHVYTTRVDGRLAGWAWLAHPSVASSVESPVPGTGFPPGAALIDGLHLPEHCGAGPLLRQVVRDASDGTASRVYLIAPRGAAWSSLVNEAEFMPAEGELTSMPAAVSPAAPDTPATVTEQRASSTKGSRRSHAA